MCKIPNTNLAITHLYFAKERGKFSVQLNDGRKVTIPVALFPDIKNLSVKEREKWMILDEHYFTFDHLTRIYSIADVLTNQQLTINN